MKDVRNQEQFRRSCIRNLRNPQSGLGDQALKEESLRVCDRSWQWEFKGFEQAGGFVDGLLGDTVGIFQELIPEDMSGFVGGGGLDLVKDAGLALAFDVGEQVCQTLVAELESGEWDCWFTTIYCGRPCWTGGCYCVVSNVIHCRGCLVCCFASPVAHTSGFSFEGEASGVGYWETNGLVIVETSNASLSCAVASGAPSAYGSVREWMSLRAVSALLSNSFVEGLRTEMNGNGFMD